MITDSVANASIPMPAAKDLAKKKRGNRTAKLKQCKMDARREQWLSLVKKKGCKEEEAQAIQVGNEGKKREMEKLEIKPTDGLNEYSDCDTPSNSPCSHVSSILGSNVSGTNFTASCGGSSSSGSFSGSVSGEDEEAEEESCFDDWEAMADALVASDDKQEDNKPGPKLPSKNQIQELTRKVVELPKPKQEQVVRVPASGRAWKPDDAFRPQSLPNLAKQKSFLREGTMGVEVALCGLARVLYQRLSRVPYVVKIWIIQTRVFTHVVVALGFVCSATRGFWKKMRVALGAGSLMSMNLSRARRRVVWLVLLA